MDRIHTKLNDNSVVYKSWKNDYAHESKRAKAELEALGYTDIEYTFGMWVIEPTGQSIAVSGLVTDSDMATYAPYADPQWCEDECDWGLEKGTVDPSHVYVDTEQKQSGLIGDKLMEWMYYGEGTLPRFMQHDTMEKHIASFVFFAMMAFVVICNIGCCGYIVSKNCVCCKGNSLRNDGYRAV